MRPFLFYLLVVLHSFAAFGEQVTTQEFHELLKTHVAQIPELSQLWKSSRGQPFYLSGGVLRGLMSFLNDEISRGGYQGARWARTPRVDELLLQEWSDRDLVVPENEKQWVHGLTGHRWDLLSDQFMQASIIAGGATLEKVMVNPDQVIDSGRAIDAFLKGQLEFKPTQIRANLNQGPLFGNSYTALALRFLRFAQNLPMAKISQASWDELSLVKDKDWDNLLRGSENDYWILKGLKKLYHSVNKDPEKFLKILHEANLISLLARHHYSLPKDEYVNLYPADFLKFVNKSNWTLEEKIDAAEVVGSSLEGKKDFLNAVLTAEGSKAYTLVQQRLSILKHIANKFGENDLYAHLKQPQKANAAKIEVNFAQPQQGGRVAFRAPADHGAVVPRHEVQAAPVQGVRMADGGIQFQIPIQVEGVPQGNCIQVVVRLGN